VTLPAHTHDGYVAAAYIAFFALLLIYVTIMAIRLGRIERKLQESPPARGKEPERHGGADGLDGGPEGPDGPEHRERRPNALEREPA
jgi:hypothetical protein